MSRSYKQEVGGLWSKRPKWLNFKNDLIQGRKDYPLAIGKSYTRQTLVRGIDKDESDLQHPFEV